MGEELDSLPSSITSNLIKYDESYPNRIARARVSGALGMHLIAMRKRGL